MVGSPVAISGRTFALTAAIIAALSKKQSLKVLTPVTVARRKAEHSPDHWPAPPPTWISFVIAKVVVVIVAAENDHAGIHCLDRAEFRHRFARTVAAIPSIHKQASKSGCE